MHDRANRARERFLTLLGNPQPVHEDSAGSLYRIPLPDEREPLVVVRLTNPSTGRVLFLRVPPTAQTAREAVAWTFGMNPEDWGPIRET